MRPKPAYKLLLLVLLVSGVAARVQTDMICLRKDLMDLSAILKYQGKTYIFFEEIAAQVVGFRNGLPVLKAGHPVDARTLWPKLDVKPSTHTIDAAFAKGSHIRFILNVGGLEDNVQNFNGFAFKQTTKFNDLVPYFKSDEYMKNGNKLYRIFAFDSVKNQANETFFTLLAYSKGQDGYFVQQLHLTLDMKLSMIFKLPKTVSKLPANSYLFSPSAILSLRFNGKTNKMITFYGTIWSPTDFSMEKTNKYFEFDPKVNYKLGGHWMGCPQVFCWEADVDAVTKLKDGSLLVFRGAYFWSLKQWPPTSVPSNPRRIITVWPQIGGHLDAAFTVKGVTYLFKDMTVYRMVSQVTGNGKDRKQEFKGSPDGRLDAASLYRNQDAPDIAYLFQGYYVWEYSVVNDQALFQRKHKLTLFKGLPKNIDGAYSPEAQLLVAYKGSFYYKAKREEKFQPILSQSRDLCRDDFYSHISWRVEGLLKITTFDGFSAYRLQFKPKPLKDADIPPETTTTRITETEVKGTDETSPDRGTTSKSSTPYIGFLWYLLLAVVLMVAVLGAVFFILINTRKGKRSALKEESSPSNISSVKSSEKTAVNSPRRSSVRPSTRSSVDKRSSIVPATEPSGILRESQMSIL